MGQSYADTKTVKNFAENFDARGLQNTASVVVSGYKADMNPTVYVQAANDIFEAAYAKVPMAAVGKINYYSKYVPMGTLETIYEAALTDRLANDARTRGRLKGVAKASKGVEESSKSVANTAQSVAQSSKTVERGNENGGRGNGREHGTNDERGEIRISGERRGQTVQDSGRKGRSMEEGTGRTEENGRPEAENGIDHYEVFFRFGDNYMKGMITVLDQKNVRTFYNLSRIENVRAIGIHPSEEGGRPPANILDYYITRENEYRKKNFQKKDSNDTRTSRETYTNISLERFKELEKNNKALEKQ